MNLRMRNRSRAALTLLAIMFVSVSSVWVAHGELSKGDWDFDMHELERLREELPGALTIKMIFTSLTSILLIGLIVVHVRVYRETGTRFSLGLVIFSIALILYTLASNPMLHRLVGFRRLGLGPLLMLPDLFMVVAAAILLYLSRQ